MRKKHTEPISEDRVVGPGFHGKVFAVVRSIPPGRVATYGQIAAVLGSPRVARQVGWALAASGQAVPPVPWHRVVNARGGVSTREAPPAELDQRTLLEAEGIRFRPSGTIDLARYRWEGPEQPDHSPRRRA